ncbi:hypothetical protein MUO83_11655 [Candidatus Bathyarchaeota archaeon]|nr:hypothetical protein [Candidatus Bathyarchaeota archaeon]
MLNITLNRDNAERTFPLSKQTANHESSDKYRYSWLSPFMENISDLEYLTVYDAHADN